MKGGKRLLILVTIAVLLFVLTLSGTALAVWPTAAQGDQYTAVNNAMTAIAAEEGIDPNTFIAIYNAAAMNQLFGELPGSSNQWLAAAFPFRTVLAALSGPLANQFTEEEVNATCRVLSRLAPYKSVLADYDTVYSNLSCGSRLAAAGPTRGALPKTGIAAIALGIMGLTAVGGLLIYKKKAVKTV